MRNKKSLICILSLAFLFATLSLQASEPKLSIRSLGDSHSLVQIENASKYILLPIQESAKEARIYYVVNNDVKGNFNVRLAVDSIDYYVPMEIGMYNNQSITLSIQWVDEKAICWDNIQLSDTFDTANRETLRPAYHFAPQYGWMNDPNGMFYKDGVWHLYYQYNPYGSMWGNMHWGHASSKDLIHWEHHPVALQPDALGAIFSGSCVVDSNNTAGFGKNAIIAFYTSASDRQMQSMAYSTDNGMTFKKYNANPIVTSSLRDFRDPKVIWHEESKKWIMVLAAGQEMQFYSSTDLKEWTYESSFGQGHGCHDGVWECPDLLKLPVEGTNEHRWVLLCNINPGGPFGGSATQYFTGNFDGKQFVCESDKDVVKWMDFGKDHYATVSFSNAPSGRHTVMAWMSNWQYANVVPTTQFRSANSVPRDISLFKHNGEVYLRSCPVKELNALRTEIKRSHQPLRLSAKPHEWKTFNKYNDGIYELDFVIKNQDAETVTITLSNDKGDSICWTYDFVSQMVSFDRTKSGNMDFHPDFPAITSCPLFSESNETRLRIYVDKCSVESFGDGGRWCMTNLVFPSEPYTHISYEAQGGKASISAEYYPINMK